MSGTTKDELHQLVDRLPEAEAQAARRFLQYLCDLGEDPVARTLREAPFDDEPLTAEEEEALEQARQEAERGQLTPHEEVLRELGYEPDR